VPNYGPDIGVAEGAPVLAVVSGWLIARRTTRPIRELTGATNRISSGELGQTITVQTGDEAGQLARAFNEMSLSSLTQDPLAKTL